MPLVVRFVFWRLFDTNESILGTKQLKAILQIMAASACHRGVVFFTFGDKEFAAELRMLHSRLRDHKVTVGSLFGMLQEYANMMNDEAEGSRSLTLFTFLSARAC